MHPRVLLIPLLGLTLVGCGDGVVEPRGPWLPDQAHSVPLRVTLGGTALYLETYLWRDFMPFAPPDGRPLAAVLRVHTVDGSPLPPGLTVPAAAVYFQSARWTSIPEAQESHAPSVLEVFSSGGPKWGPGVSVDVVVFLALGEDRAMLRAAGQPIHRTD